MEAATSATAIVTPSVVKNHPGVAKAYVSFNSSGTIQGTPLNVSSVVRTASGLYTITFTDAFSTANYVGIGTCPRTSGDDRFAMIGSTTTTQAFMATLTSGGSVADAACNAVFFGDF